jgi:hypothetical protein
MDLGHHPSSTYAHSERRTFPETGKTVSGRFLQHWDTNGGLARYGLPISDEVGEISDTDGQLCTVQYFERGVLELHPDNRAPNDVIPSNLGSMRYHQRYRGGAPNQRPSTAPGAIRFKETGKTLGGPFLIYWQSKDGDVLLGLPISDEFEEKSDLDGDTRTVQYFQRGMLELHPDEPEPMQAVFPELGTLRYNQRSAAGDWGAPPYPVPAAVVIADTPMAPTNKGRGTASTTATPTQGRSARGGKHTPTVSSTGELVISFINYDGLEPRTEGDEYVAIKNTGTSPINLEGYTINAGDRGQDFTFPSHTLKPGAEVRVYTNRDVRGSFSFGVHRAIWNNRGECGYLYDPQGVEVSTYCY